MTFFNYDTYQDVRHNLFHYSLPVLIGAGFFAYFFILPDTHQKVITSLFQYLTNTQPWNKLIGTSAGLVLFGAIAFIFTELLQVHDQWYDKYITKWRYQYAIDFILPRLVQPFANRLNYRFHETLEKYTGQFQEQLYYPFVGDRDLKIPKNKLVRFYEVITVYWLTIINEIVIFILFGVIATYRFIGPSELAYRTNLLSICIIVPCLFIANRVFMKRILKKVRQATAEEIRAIHDDEILRNDLESRLAKICVDYGVPYEEG